MLFSKKGPKLTELQGLILPVTTEIGMEKIRCIFNYQMSRVYAFHTLNSGSFYSRLISQSTLKKKKNKSIRPPPNGQSYFNKKNYIYRLDISGVSKPSLQTH